MSNTERRDKVLIAVDGSQQAEEAFDWYIKHLHSPKNTVILVHAGEGPAMPTRESWDQQHKDIAKKVKALEEKYREKLATAHIEGRWITEMEKPGECVVDTAAKEGVDFIVIGTRGMGTVRRTLMGSVSDFVVHNAGCPVMVCRSEKEKEKQY